MTRVVRTPGFSGHGRDIGLRSNRQSASLPSDLVLGPNYGQIDEIISGRTVINSGTFVISDAVPICGSSGHGERDVLEAKEMKGAKS
jgi:hypothetical protein